MSRYLGGVLILLLIALAVVFKPALAQAEQVFEQKRESQRVIVEPALQEVVVENEARVDASVILENTTSSGQRYTIRLVDFGSLDESGGVAFLGSGDPRDYQDATWMETGVNDIVVPPNAKAKLDIIIKNDENFSPGGHYGAVLFEKAALEGDAAVDKTEVAINQVFSALVYVRKVGGEVFALDFLDHEYRKNFWRLPETVALRFANNGNVHMIPRGTIRISDPLGSVVQKATLNQSSGLVLPQSKRRFEERFQLISFAWLPGKYTVRTEYRYDGKDSFEIVAEKYWYFPPLTGASLLILVGGGLYTKKWLKKRKKSQK